MREKKPKKNNIVWVMVMTLFLITMTAVIGIVVFRFYMSSFNEVANEKEYDRYYVMITEDSKSSFWQSVYRGAYEQGLLENTYVDMLGDNLAHDYSREDLMHIAISSNVDGIIVAADESEQLSELINEAAAQGIPVVTLYGDNTHSDRCSFVGVGGYNLGREYGKQVLEIAEEKLGETGFAYDGTYLTKVENTAAEDGVVKVAILVNANAQDSSQNILCSGIQETIEIEKKAETEIELSLITIDDTNAFSMEESIRDLFMEGDTPDIFVCLNELSTTCVYQAVVDYNRVGLVNILGYYDSDTILKAIDRNVIYATVSIDTAQMGRYCVNALNEYHELGYTSQYFTADIDLIKKSNVRQYLEGGEEDE